MEIIGGIVSALDVGIRLVFVYLILGLGTATLQEALAAVWRLRAKNLRRALHDLLRDAELKEIDLAREVIEHPLLRSRQRGGMPSYISAQAFRIALLDVLGRVYSLKTSDVMRSPRSLIEVLPERSQMRTVFEAFNAEEREWGGDFPRQIEYWFSDSMEAASANYRFGTLNRLFAIAVVLTILANVNTFRVLEVLFIQTIPVIASSSTTVEPVTVTSTQARRGSLIGWDVDGENMFVKMLPTRTPLQSGHFSAFWQITPSVGS